MGKIATYAPGGYMEAPATSGALFPSQWYACEKKNGRGPRRMPGEAAHVTLRTFAKVRSTARYYPLSQLFGAIYSKLTVALCSRQPLCTCCFAGLLASAPESVAISLAVCGGGACVRMWDATMSIWGVLLCLCNELM